MNIPDELQIMRVTSVARHVDHTKMIVNVETDRKPEQLRLLIRNHIARDLADRILKELP